MTHVTLKPLASEESIEVYGWLLANVGKGSFSKTGRTLDDDMQWSKHFVWLKKYYERRSARWPDLYYERVMTLFDVLKNG